MMLARFDSVLAMGAALRRQLMKPANGARTALSARCGQTATSPARTRLSALLHELALAALLLTLAPCPAQETNAHPIDLPTALKLAGAQNLDVKIARERLAEARANHSSALAQFFPWISPGITYRRHDDKIQDVEGNIIDVNKYSYAPGGALAAQVDIGDALYKSLAAKQLVKAADQALQAQRQDSVLAAAQGYFALALAQGSVGVAKESLSINTDYESQIQNALTA